MANRRYDPPIKTLGCTKCGVRLPIGEWSAAGWTGQPVLDAHQAACKGATVQTCGCAIPAGTPPFFARQMAARACESHS